MPIVPTIKQDDITISEKYTQGYDEARCVKALWLVYNVIKDIVPCKGKGLVCLYSTGVFGRFENDDLSALTVDYQKKDVKARAWFSKPAYLFDLENYGFSVFDLELIDDSKAKNKLTKKDIIQFRISYKQNNDLLLGLKLFAAACSKISGDPFYVGDIRIMFKGVAKMYAPPVDEVFYTLDADQKQTAIKLHEKLESIGCKRNLERDYMMKYFHPKIKGKPFATIYPVTQFWFFGPEQEGRELSIKLNLRNIGKYADYLTECTETVRKSILNTQDCYGCKKSCGGIQFTYNGERYAKCPWYIFWFNDFSDKAVENYMRLVQLENNQLVLGRKAE